MISKTTTPPREPVARLRAPFPYYGSKIAAAPLIETLMGTKLNNLVVPFAGSLGELLGRTTPAKVETVNDADGLVVNAWRAIVYSPEETSAACDHPVHEATLHAAHERLVARADDLRDLIFSDPKAHDIELAAWWIWGASCWLGSGWCVIPGGSQSKKHGGARVQGHDRGQGVAKPLDSIGSKGGIRMRVVGREGTPFYGEGVAKPVRTHRKTHVLGGPGSGDGPPRPDLGRGVAKPCGHETTRQIPLLRGSDGTGVGYGVGINTGPNRERLLEYFSDLATRLRWVRITCGDWKRVVTPAVTVSHGLTGVSLDPPYAFDRRSKRLYRKDSPDISGEVREWALEHGEDALLRITLAGKGDEHDALLEHGWTRHQWRKDGETIWASPLCNAVAVNYGPLFAETAVE